MKWKMMEEAKTKRYWKKDIKKDTNCIEKQINGAIKFLIENKHEIK